MPRAEAKTLEFEAVEPSTGVTRAAERSITPLWPAAGQTRLLVVVPTLDEEARIEAVLTTLLAAPPAGVDVRIVVADGGSKDATVAIVRAVAERHPNVHLCRNPARVQSAGVNLAVREFGRDRDVLVRCDAHATYPDRFCERLLATLTRHAADAVVVPLVSIGETPLQRAIAWLSNSPLGTGGSAHRGSTRSGFVDHGHHAAFRLESFRRAGGYDETFSHNEDAELDCRQRAFGAGIYLDAELGVRYFPRESLGALARQYMRYGEGRSRTARRHPLSFRLRQLAVPLHFVVCALSLALAPLSPWLLAWPLAYLATLGAASVVFCLRERSLSGLLVGPAALVMHAAWAWGFISGLLRWRQPAWRRSHSKPLWDDPRRDGEREPVQAVLVDPSLFTAPYDGALCRGLVAAGVRPVWAVRPVRPGDQRELPEAQTDELFYKKTDRLTRVPRPLRAVLKGLSHALGLALLVRRVVVTRPDVVHFQWLVLPPLDALAILAIRRFCPVVVTVHDSLPYNGDRSKQLQALAADLPLRLSDRLVVLARSARARLVARGFSADSIKVIPHGPMPLPQASRRPAAERDGRFTFVLFGELKSYKGVDVLVEAVGLLPVTLRRHARVIVAGRPRMSLAGVQARAEALGLADIVEFWPRRLSESEMADLFELADSMVFPYRQIDASGVYYQAKSARKWIIASRLGIFAEDLREGASGALVPPDEPRALAAALAHALATRPVAASENADTSWQRIGALTRELYEELRAARGTP